jgi:hypothetical protein
VTLEDRLRGDYSITTIFSDDPLFLAEDADDLLRATMNLNEVMIRYNMNILVETQRIDVIRG